MEKISITIKKGVRYLSEIDGFKLPYGIVNKGITDCGATHWALTNGLKEVICSPRNRLLENKHSQHPDSLLVIGGVREEEIRDYMEKALIPKILVSYDSLPKVIRCIPTEEYADWNIVVDEFHFLLSDSGLKSEVELRTLECLRPFANVTYLSATPFLDKYLAQIDMFKDIPYFEFVWESARKISVKRFKVTKPMNAALSIIRTYQNGNYPVLETEEGCIKSTECVIFLNSVTGIVNLIKQADLKPEEVNIIAAKTNENDKLIGKLGDGFKNGDIPERGELHKMVTLCTSTAYAGCDFYSTNASTFVISDVKKNSTAVDIATELKQIAGRQRLDANAFRNHIVFIYSTSVLEKGEDEFKAGIDEKVKLTEAEVENKNALPELLRKKSIKDTSKLQRIERYSDSYTMYDEKSDRFIFNRMAYLYELFSYDIQKEYENGFTVRESLQSSKFDIMDKQQYVDEFDEQVSLVIARMSFAEKMKLYCEYRTGQKVSFQVMALEQDCPELRYYFDTLGAARIKALGYKESDLKKEIKCQVSLELIKLALKEHFIVGVSYSTQQIKETMNMVYEKLGVEKKGVASDLYKLYGFEMKSGKIALPEGGRVNGYKIIDS